MGTEKRKHPRAEITWGAMILASNGYIDGETRNLSAGGVFLICSKAPEPDDNFRLILKPRNREFLLTTVQKVWAGSMTGEGDDSEGMGVRFIELSPEDQEFITSMIESYLESEDSETEQADLEGE
jgi:hypothetical protein